MVKHVVTIPPRVLCGLRRHALADAPAECCGSLFGLRQDGGLSVRSQIPLPNRAAADNAYVIDAHTVLRLERQASSAGVELIGFYHSHPASTAYPSALDVELALPGYVYLIVEGATGAVRGWTLRDDRASFTELELTALEGAA